MTKEEITELAFEKGYEAKYSGKQKKFYFVKQGYDKSLPDVDMDKLIQLGL